MFYLKAGRTHSYAFQLEKFLYVIKDHLVVLAKKLFSTKFSDKTEIFQEVSQDCLLYNLCYPEKDGFENMLHGIESIAIKVLNAITWAYDVSNRPQILKYREIFQNAHDRDEDRHLIQQQYLFQP
ncbi:MAG: hypothetical protein H6559_21530 [Lewinellaceae bacterium]|nr:hypothetical protein [Lewinellaceae bacterium]